MRPRSGAEPRMACGVPAVPGDGARGRGEHATVVGFAVAGRRQRGVWLAGFDRSLGAQPLHVQFGADGASCATAITTTRAWPDSRLSLVTRERCVRGEGGSLDAGRLFGTDGISGGAAPPDHHGTRPRPARHLRSISRAVRRSFESGLPLHSHSHAAMIWAVNAVPSASGGVPH